MSTWGRRSKLSSNLPDSTEPDRPPTRSHPDRAVRAGPMGAAALAHASDTVEHGTMAPKGSDGSTPAQRVGRPGSLDLETGENGYPSPAAVARNLRDSPDHEEGLLGDFAELGVGYAPCRRRDALLVCAVRLTSVIVARSPGRGVNVHRAGASR